MIIYIYNFIFMFFLHNNTILNMYIYMYIFIYIQLSSLCYCQIRHRPLLDLLPLPHHDSDPHLHRRGSYGFGCLNRIQLNWLVVGYSYVTFL